MKFINNLLVCFLCVNLKYIKLKKLKIEVNKNMCYKSFYRLLFEYSIKVQVFKVFDQSSSFSPTILVLWRENQLSFSAILPILIMILSDFLMILDYLTKIWHWVLGTAKIQFFPLKSKILISKLLSRNLEWILSSGCAPIPSIGM